MQNLCPPRHGDHDGVSAIVDIETGAVLAYEALVSGVDGQPAGEILASVDADMIYTFDQTCRVRAIELAGQLFPPNDATKLLIKFMPNAIYEPDVCIRASLTAARDRDSAARHAIVAGVLGIAEAIGVRCIAKGIETAAELRTLKVIGIRLCQNTRSHGLQPRRCLSYDRERLRS